MINKLHIRKHEFGLWFRHGDFERLLEPGAYWLPGRWAGHDRVQVVDTLNTRFQHALLDLLVEDIRLREALLVVELRQSQRALVWKDGRLGWVLGPGRHAFWRKPYALEVEVFDVRDVAFEHPQLEAILADPEGQRMLWTVHVEPGERTIVYLDGQRLAELGPGRYAFWNRSGRLTNEIVDLREQVADVAGQEIMTADKVTLRVNLLVAWKVRDPAQAVSAVDDYRQALYRESQLALRAAVGGRTLEKLLSDKQTVGAEVRAAVTERASEFGVVVKSVGLRDVILPGDMKTILNQVIEAQKQAEANLIRRREETAAARSQANTAKLLAENPVLLRMKEMEALQDILKGAKTTFVFGAGDLGEQVRRLVTNVDEEE